VPPTFAVEPTETAVKSAPEHFAEAERLFAEAQRYYDAGDLRQALRALEDCYARTHAPNLLYNRARVHVELSECSKARELYGQFVREVQDDALRADANAELAKLNEDCPLREWAGPLAKNAATVTPPPVQSKRSRVAPEPSQSTRRTSVFAWAVLGTGAAAGVATAYFTVASLKAYEDTEKHGVDAGFHYEREADLTRNSTLAWALGVTTVLSVGFGTYLLAAPRREQTASSLTVAWLPRMAVVDYRLRF
jgi:tetratricopeptide (TPR) repeat protein